MAKRSKSPRKNLGKQSDFYKSDGHNEDFPDIASRERKDTAKVPSRYRYSIGYKEPRNKPMARARNEYHKSSSESSYEEESESENEERGVMKGISQKKKTMMVVTRLERGSQGERNNEDEDINDLGNDKSSPEHAITNFRKRIFNDSRDNNDSNEESDREGSWMNEKMKKDDEITELKKKIKTLESTIHYMQNTSRTTSRDKTGWSGEDLMFVKEINDFCRDKIYPKEKFLRKNWQEYLPNDRRSLYSVCMKHLSIPDGSDKREIWNRVIVPSIRDKYQSMRCNMNNKMKAIYMSMKCFF
jgi:hypothetical protein